MRCDERCSNNSSSNRRCRRCRSRRNAARLRGAIRADPHCRRWFGVAPAALRNASSGRRPGMRPEPRIHRLHRDRPRRTPAMARNALSHPKITHISLLIDIAGQLGFRGVEVTRDGRRQTSRGHDTILLVAGPLYQHPCDPSSVGFNVSLSSRKLFSFTSKGICTALRKDHSCWRYVAAFGDPSVLNWWRRLARQGVSCCGRGNMRADVNCYFVSLHGPGCWRDVWSPQVRSPAPPMIALVGLFGMLL